MSRKLIGAIIACIALAGITATVFALRPDATNRTNQQEQSRTDQAATHDDIDDLDGSGHGRGRGGESDGQGQGRGRGGDDNTDDGAAATAPQTPPADATQVAITNFAYSPKTITVKKGTTVTWTNNDTAEHTITGDDGGPDSALFGKGETFSYTFNTAGTFSYFCKPHPNMKGTVVVTE